MGFFSQIEAPIRNVLKTLFLDQTLKKRVTYRRYKGQTFNETEKVHEIVFTSIPVDAIRLQHLQKSMFVGVGEIQAGDEVYLIQSSSVAFGMPTGHSLRDEITDENGGVQKIKSINDIFGLAFAVTMEST